MKYSLTVNSDSYEDIGTLICLAEILIPGDMDDMSIPHLLSSVSFFSERLADMALHLERQGWMDSADIETLIEHLKESAQRIKEKKFH